MAAGLGANCDDAHLLIALGELYVNLHSCPLAQPNRVAVFADAQAAANYGQGQILWQESSNDSRTHQPWPGSVVNWDGKRWEFVNFGQTQVILRRTDDDSITRLPVAAYASLVKDGQFTLETPRPRNNDADLDLQLLRASEEDLRQGNYRYEVVRRILNGEKPERITSVSSRTSRRWIAMYKRADAGQGCGYLGLLPLTRQRGNSTSKLPEASRELMTNIIHEDYETLKQKSMYASWCSLQAACRDQGLIAPSYETFRLAIHGHSGYSQTLKRMGPRAAYQRAAVKEEIAHARLAAMNRSRDAGVGDAIAHGCSVRLTNEDLDGHRWLVCKDNGAGMTKATIEHCLLVSGRARRHEILDLERRCKTAGFQLGRSGQFGIGVLSYFMLADRVVIRTRRSPSTGDTDLDGWEFTCDGIGSFGELKHAYTLRPGTEVRLRLRPEFGNQDLSAWNTSLWMYLKPQLSRIPCNFQLLSGDEVLFDKNAGWMLSEEDIWEGMLPRARDLRKGINKKMNEAIRRVINDGREAMHIFSCSGVVADDTAAYRISVPYFSTPSGTCLLYMQTSANGSGLDGLNVDYGPSGTNERVIISWNGCVVFGDKSRTSENAQTPYKVTEILERWLPGGIVEIDFQSAKAGAISVNRSSMEINKTGLALVQTVAGILRQEVEIFCEKHSESLYASINRCFSENLQIETNNLRWFFEVTPEDNADEAIWTKVHFPMMPFLEGWSGVSLAAWRADHRGQPVCLLKSRTIRSFPGGSKGELGFPWDLNRFPPDHIVLYPRLPGELSGSRKGRTVGISGIWSGLSHSAVSGGGRLLCEFPREWLNLVGVRVRVRSRGYRSHRVFWGNPTSNLISLENKNSREWNDGMCSRSSRFASIREDLLVSRSRMATWMLETLLNRDGEAIWTDLVRQDPDFLTYLWKFLGLSQSIPWIGYIQVDKIAQESRSTGIVLHAVSPQAWERLEGDAMFERLSRPASEWWLTLRPYSESVDDPVAPDT